MKTKITIIAMLVLVSAMSFGQAKQTVSRPKSNVYGNFKKIEQAPPVTGIGTVIKKNPGSGASKVISDSNGGFSLKLEEGVYTISIPKKELATKVAEIKANYPEVTGAVYEFDSTSKFVFTEVTQNELGEFIPKGKNNEFTITVPKGGTTFSGKLLSNSSGTSGLCIRLTEQNKGAGSPKSAGF